jgi:hypothetical protein
MAAFANINGKPNLLFYNAGDSALGVYSLPDLSLKSTHFLYLRDLDISDNGETVLFGDTVGTFIGKSDSLLSTDSPKEQQISALFGGDNQIDNIGQGVYFIAGNEIERLLYNNTIFVFTH